MALTRIRRPSPASRGLRKRQPPKTRAPRADFEALTIGALYDIALHGASASSGTLHGASSRALTAAAVNVQQRNAQDIRRLIQPWQARSMSYYDLIPEIKFYAEFKSQILRRVRLFPAILDPDTQEPEEITDGPPVEVFGRIIDRNGGRAELQSSYGKLKSLIGEGYLTVSPDESRGEVWEYLSPNELRVQPGGIATRFRAPMLSGDQYIIGNDEATIAEYGEQLDAQPGRNLAPRPDIGPAFSEHGPDVIVVYRLWRQHPAYSWLADCNMQAVIDLCEELVLSTYSVRAELKSRLNRGGILWVPDEISFTSLGNDPEEDPASDDYQQLLTTAFTAALSNPGTAAAFSPIVSRIAGEWIKDVKWMKFNDNAGDLAEISQRTEMVERLGIGLELPPELFKSQGDLNHWCVDAETEVLTRDRGWVTNDALEIGDVIRTLNHVTGLAEWQPVLDLYRADAQNEPMRLIDTATHSSLTTLNHKWPVLHTRQRNGERYVSREWTTTAKLGVDDKIITGAFSGDEPSSTHPDDLVELAAWYWTEGSGDTDIRIAQSHTRNPERVDRIRGALTRLLGPAKDSLREVEGEAWREKIQTNAGSHGGPITVFYLNRRASRVLSEAAPGKRLSADFLCSLTRAQLDLFIDVSCQGDGQHYHQGRLDIWQKEADALDGYELAVALSGRATSRRPDRDKGTRVSALRSLAVRPIKATVQRTRVGYGTARDEIVSYTGVVWCPVTANHTWLARRNGFSYFTGNTGWLIDEQTWKSYGHPAALEMASDLNSAYLQPTLRAENFKGWENVVVGIDATEVVNHPDRAKDAMALYDRRCISKTVMLEALGYNENDLPPEDELNEMIGVAIRDGSYARYGIPAVRANIEPNAGDIESAQGGAETTVNNPVTGSENEPGPPASGSGQEGTQGGPALQASGAVDDRQARLLGAAEFAVQRGRELAGARLRAMVTGRNAARCEECARAVEAVPNWDVAAALGADQVLALRNGQTSALCDGTAQAFAAVAERMGLPAARALEIGELVEQHAARTLFDEVPAAFPKGFARMLAR